MLTPLRAGALCLLLAAPALCQDPVGPPFQGPPVHDGAWPVLHAWSDSAAGPDDRSRGSFAYAYREWARERADAHVAAGTRLDCADLSIDLVCEYAAAHGLPLTWRVYYAPEHKFVNVSASDRQFGSPEQFRTWSKWFLGAMNLADNTYPVTYEEWAGGDMVLMNWGQTDVEPNFPGRTVWHTYLIGLPDQTVYYGNEDDQGQPLPVTRLTQASDPVRMDRVRNHPDRYGLSPRRFLLLRGALWGPQVRVDEAVVRPLLLNLRAGPGTSFPVLGRGRAGERAAVVARDGVWLQLRLADGRLVWAHGAYLRQETTWRPAEPPVAPLPTSTGLVSVVDGH